MTRWLVNGTTIRKRDFIIQFDSFKKGIFIFFYLFLIKLTTFWNCFGLLNNIPRLLLLILYLEFLRAPSKGEKIRFESVIEDCLRVIVLRNFRYVRLPRVLDWIHPCLLSSTWFKLVNRNWVVKIYNSNLRVACIYFESS